MMLKRIDDAVENYVMLHNEVPNRIYLGHDDYLELCRAIKEGYMIYMRPDSKKPGYGEWYAGLRIYEVHEQNHFFICHSPD